jgi:CheY-like chemotaxis protein/two-component sensor histidine kinase
LNYTSINKSWQSTVFPIKAEINNLLAGNSFNENLILNLSDLFSVTKALGLIGPYRFIQTLIFMVNKCSDIDSKEAKNYKVAISEALDKLFTYLEFLTAGGLDRENWFHTEVQELNKLLRIKTNTLHYRLDSKRLKAILETEIIEREADIEKTNQIRSIAQNKVSVWTEELRKEPNSEQTKIKLNSLLLALQKTSEYQINANVLWVYSTLIKLLITNKDVNEIVISNLSTEIEKTVELELQGKQIVFKKIRRPLITSLVLLIENNECFEIEKEFLDHFELSKNIEQFKIEQLDSDYREYSNSNNIINEFLEAANRLICEIRSSYDEKNHQYQLSVLKSISTKVFGEVRLDINKKSSEELIIKNLAGFITKCEEIKSGPTGKVTNETIDFTSVKEIRAHLYDTGKKISEQIQTNQTLVAIPPNQEDEPFYRIYKKLISSASENISLSQRKQLIFATAALFEWSDQAIRSNSKSNTLLLNKADSMLQCFNNTEQVDIEIDDQSLFNIESSYLLDTDQHDALENLIAINILNKSVSISTLPEKFISKYDDYNRPNGSTQKSIVRRKDTIHEINFKPLIDDILSKYDHILSCLQNLRRKNVTETTLLDVRSILHTLKGTSGLTYCKETYKKFRALESEFEHLRLNNPSVQSRIKFADKTIEILDSYTKVMTHSVLKRSNDLESETKINLESELRNIALKRPIDLKSIDDIDALNKIQSTRLKSASVLSTKVAVSVAVLRRQLQESLSDELHDVLNRIELFAEDIGLTISDAQITNKQANETTSSLYRKTKALIEQSPMILNDRLQTVVSTTVSDDQYCRLSLNTGNIQIHQSEIYQIAPYLEHLVRNAVDHGIGKAEERLSLEKSETGQIKIDFNSNGPDLTITVEDDGHGLDFNKIYHEMGELEPEREKNKITNYLKFLENNGVSTLSEDRLTSGKGIGLHSVTKFVNTNNGKLSITSNETGTRFKMTLPNKALSIKCLIVRQASLIIAIPTDYIKTVDYSHVKKGGIDLFKLCGFKSNNLISASLTLKLKNTDVNVSEILDVQEITPRYTPIYSDTYIGWGKQIDSSTALIIRPNVLLRENLTKKVSELADYPVVNTNKLLVVDDSKPMRDTIGGLVSKLGFDFLTAYDGIDALSKLKSRSDIQAMVVDIDMPRLNGINLIEKLKLDPVYKDMPIIVVSGKTSGRTKQAVANLNINQFITKPFDTSALMNAIERVMP